MVQPLNKDSEQMSPSYDTPSRSDTVGTSSHSSSDTEKDVEVDAKPVGSTLYDLSQVAPLAPASNTDTTPGASILQCLGIRRGHKRDLDAVCLGLL